MSAEQERMDRLEEQSFFQEQTLTALHEALLGQQHQIDRLEQRLARAEERVRELTLRQSEAEGESSPPPHYSGRVDNL